MAVGLTYYLLKNPKAMQRLTEEIRSTFVTEDEINFKSVANLVYLNDCLDEGLRMYPAEPIGFPRRVPAGRETIAEYFVPEGTSVSVSHYSTYRSSRNFKIPHSFILDRWLDDPCFASDDKSALQPFLAGVRNCLGKNLATAETRLILVRLLWNFDLALSEEQQSRDWADQKVYFVWEKGSLNVGFTARKFGHDKDAV